jgi:hypothetical protein
VTETGKAKEDDQPFIRTLHPTHGSSTLCRNYLLKTPTSNSNVRDAQVAFAEKY